MNDVHRPEEQVAEPAATAMLELWKRLGISQFTVATTFLDNIEEGALVQDANGVAIWCTGAASKILGLTPDELYGRKSIDPRWGAITVDGQPLPGEQHPPMITLTTGRELDGYVMGIQRPDGDRRWVSVTTRALRTADGEMVGVMSIFQDVTALHLNRQRTRTVMMFAPIGIGATDASGIVVNSNEHLTATVGQDIIGARPSDLLRNVHPAYQAELEAAFTSVLDPASPTELDVEAPVEVSGVNRWLRFRATPVLNGDAIDGCVFTVEDVHDARVGAEALEYRARHDALTGLANRGQLETRLRELTAAPDARTAVLLVDLDGFKEINDALGHAVGDQLLRSVAVRLRMACRSADIVARMGGDEFAVAIARSGDGEPERIAERILQVMAQPFGLGDRSLSVGASIGIAVQASDGESHVAAAAGLELLRESDLALYEAKSKGKNRFALYQPAMSDASTRRFAIRSALTAAEDDNEFAVVYKPVVRLSDGMVTAFDALVRWENNRLGVVTPAEFIPVAEETGDIRRLVIHLLDASIDTLSALQSTAGDGIELAMDINISHQNLDDPSFLGDLAAVVRSHRIDPQRLVAKITEQGLREHPLAPAALRAIADLGLQITIDDFGGAGPLESLARDFPVDMVKIDRRLVRLLHTDERRATALLRSVVDVANALDLVAIAAGVETRRHLAVVKSLGFQAAQGFVFGQPMPRHEAVEFLRDAMGRNLIDEP